MQGGKCMLNFIGNWQTIFLKQRSHYITSCSNPPVASHLTPIKAKELSVIFTFRNAYTYNPLPLPSSLRTPLAPSALANLPLAKPLLTQGLSMNCSSLRSACSCFLSSMPSLSNYSVSLFALFYPKGVF